MIIGMEADMATVRKTITLTEQQDAWIAAQIDFDQIAVLKYFGSNLCADDAGLF